MRGYCTHCCQAAIFFCPTTKKSAISSKHMHLIFTLTALNTGVNQFFIQNTVIDFLKTI
jgi:hypothetical protein